MSDADKHELQPERVHDEIKSKSGKTADEFSEAKEMPIEKSPAAEHQKQDAFEMPHPEPGREWGHASSHVKTNNELRLEAEEAQMVLQHARKNEEIRQSERKPVSLEKENDNSKSR